MPIKTTQVKAERYLTCKGITVYHGYEGGDIDDRLEWHFMTDPYGEGAQLFDVRELSTWEEPQHPPYLVGENDTQDNRDLWLEHREGNMVDKACRKAIRAAVKSGEITPDTTGEDVHRAFLERAVPAETPKIVEG